MRSPRMRLVALAAAPLMFLAACQPGGGSGDDDSATTSAPDDAAATSLAPSGNLADVGVDDPDGVPSLTWSGSPFGEGDLPFVAGQTDVETVAEGDGEEVESTDEVDVRYLAVNGSTGEQVLSTFDAGDVVTMDLNNENLFPAFRNELPGRQVGDTLLLAIPPDDAFGPGGNPNLGVGAEDTMLFYIAIDWAGEPLTQAEGEDVEPVDGLPEVEADGTSAAVVTIGDAEPPSELVAQTLVRGDRPEVRAGQTIRVHYTGVTFSDGEQFESSLDSGQPFTTRIGAGQVIEGWDEGLVGQTVGSRVLLVIPAEQAYGPDPEAHNLGGEDLIFVVDILGAY